MFSNDLLGKIKVFDTTYDEVKGISEAFIQTRLGIFKGESKLNPIDAQHQSRFVGYEYAKIRATLKYIKARMREIDSQIKIVQMIRDSSDFNHYTNKTLTNYIEDLTADKLTLKVIYKNMQKELKEKITQRDTINEKLDAWLKVYNKDK